MERWREIGQSPDVRERESRERKREREKERERERAFYLDHPINQCAFRADLHLLAVLPKPAWNGVAV